MPRSLEITEEGMATIPTSPVARGVPGADVRRRLLLLGCHLAIVAATAATMLAAGWDRPEFGRHPDEAGHFMTGVLVHDWAAGGFDSDPLEFARQFQARYPKVALGHWPPLFYAIQAAWYGCFGVSHVSALLLTLVLDGSFLLLLFECLRRRVGSIGSALATAFVIASPVFRYSSSLFMTDLFLALWGLAAVWTYAVYLERGSAWAALGFGGLGTLALLTKQDAAALGLIPPVCVVLLRRWDLLKDWKFYAPGVMVVAVCGPVYYVMAQHNVSAFTGLEGPSRLAKLGSLAQGLTLGGWGGGLLTAAGIAAACAAGLRGTRLGLIPAVFVARVVGYGAVQLATPVSLDPRYRTALLATTAFCWAMAFQAVASSGRWRAGPRALALAALAAVALLGRPAYQDRQVTGYRDLVGAIRPGDGLCVVLICSDTMGDGAIVSEFRIQHPGGRFCVLRADKVLASSTWMGENYRLKFDTPARIEDYLNRQPVHLIVVDDWAHDSGTHAEKLEALLRGHPDRFVPVATYPIVRRQYGHRTVGAARLYQVAATQGLRPREIEVDLSNMPGGPVRVSIGPGSGE
jgi:hypothetical protein